MRKLFNGLVVSLALALSAGASAHQLKSALTKMLFNQRSGNVEIMHRFYIHDAEHALKQLFKTNADLISDEDAQALFAHYVEQRFFISNQETLIPLNLVGYEIEGKFLWIYQETPIDEAITSLDIRNNALREIWTTQVNTVNIEGIGDIKTLTFDGNTESLQVTLHP